MFLTAEWRHLAMLNYRVDPAVLQALVPAGTELDFYEGQTFISMVGFLFLNTRVLGVAIPFHQNFEEVNLRFYVRRRGPEGWRRGVVFIRELVPRVAIALIARAVYNENYATVKMAHWVDSAPATDSLREVSYSWNWHHAPHKIHVQVRGNAQEIMAGSEAEFITEHYWGYTPQRDGSTKEYRVEHPRWRIWPAEAAALTGPLDGCYGAEFARLLKAPPNSAFVADGSEVSVCHGKRI